MKAAGTKQEVPHNVKSRPTRKEPFSFADGLCIFNMHDFPHPMEMQQLYSSYRVVFCLISCSLCVPPTLVTVDSHKVDCQMVYQCHLSVLLNEHARCGLWG